MPTTSNTGPARTALASRGVRTARASIGSSLAVFVALFFHVLGGGTMPAPIVLVAALALALPAALLLIGRSLSTVRLGAVVVAAQAVLHVLFGMGMTGSLVRSGADAHVSHALHSSTPPMTMADGSSSTLSGGSGLLDLSTGMTLAHILAAGITLLALRLGEGAFWSLISRVAWELRRLLPAVRLVPRPARALADVAGRREDLRSLLLDRTAVRHRGPPVPA